MDLIRAKTEWFNEMGYVPHGVVHVGAHLGEEIPWYLHRNMIPVIAIEANPEIFSQLVANFADEGNVQCVRAVLGERNEKSILHIGQHLHAPIDDTMGASLLQPNREYYSWGNRETIQKHLPVEVHRFDSLYSDDLFNHLTIDTLVIDVQGMELEVLKGFGDLLNNFDFLNIECSEKPIYNGEASAEEVVVWLAIQGFERKTPIVSHDDILFVRYNV